MAAQVFRLGDRDPIHWAKDSVWEGVEGVCGIQKPQDGEPLPTDWVVNDIMVWWFAVASKFNPEINLPSLRPWRAPRWLARDRRETEDVLRKRTGYLWLRVNRAIEDEVALAEMRRASNRKVEESKAAFSAATQGSKPDGPMAAQRKQSRPAPTAPSVVDPFATLKPGETVIECSPLSAEDTDTTGPAIRLLQKLGFSAEWPPPSFPIRADVREKLERARRVVQARGVLVDGEPLNPLADGRSWVMPCKLPDDLSKREDAPDQVRRWLESEGVKVAARPVWQNGRLLICLWDSGRVSAQNTPLVQAASKTPRTSSLGRPPSVIVANRREVLRKVAATGLTGARYCAEVMRKELSTPLEWQKSGCPKNYLDAWNHSDSQRRKKYRQRISDEKYKATKGNSP